MLTPCRIGLALASFSYPLGVHVSGIPLRVMFSVAVALPCVSCIANLIGAGLPLICEKFQVDPAVIAAPCMTTLVDCVGILTYLYISGIIIGVAAPEEEEGEGGEEGAAVEGESGCGEACTVDRDWQSLEGGRRCLEATCEDVGIDGTGERKTAAVACCLEDCPWEGCAFVDNELSEENKAILAGKGAHCDTEEILGEECYAHFHGHEDWAIDPETCQLHQHAEREGDATIDGFMMVLMCFMIVLCAISGYKQWQEMQAEEKNAADADEGEAALAHGAASNGGHDAPAVEEMEPVKYLVLNTSTVRRGPNADSEKLGEFKAKQMIECVEKTTNAAGLEVLRTKKGSGPLDGGWVKTVTSKGKQLLHQLPGAQFPGDPSPHIIPKGEIEAAIKESLDNLSLLPDSDIDAAKVMQQLANTLQVQIILQTDAHKHQRALKAVPLLASMTAAELKPIIETLEVVNFTSGQEVISEDGTDQELYVVMAGTAVCTKLGAGDGGPIKHYKKADFFGERAALANEPRAATVTADSDLTVLKLDRSAYNLVLDSANVDIDVVNSLQKKYQQTCGTPEPRQRRQQHVSHVRGAASGGLGAHGGPTVMGAMRGAFKGGARRGSATSDTSDTQAPAGLRSSMNVEEAPKSEAGATPGSPRRYSDPVLHGVPRMHAPAQPPPPAGMRPPQQRLETVLSHSDDYHDAENPLAHSNGVAPGTPLGATVPPMGMGEEADL